MSRREEMFGHVRRWRQSGMSKSAYAARQELSYQTLHYWDRKYTESAAQRSDEFIPVTVIDDTATEQSVRLVITVGTEIRIEVR